MPNAAENAGRLLHIMRAAGVQCVSVDLPDNDKARVQYALANGSTSDASANAIIASFDLSDAAHETWLANRHPDRKALADAAQQALADNATFLAIGTPSNAQVLAQVRALTRQNNQLIRRLVQL